MPFREEGEIQGRTIGIYPEIKSAAATNRILAGRGEELRSNLQFSKKILEDFLYKCQPIHICKWIKEKHLNF